MSLFLSTYVNKLDRKGRVSVPAAFRVALLRQGEEAEGAGLVLFRSSTHPCLEGFPLTAMQELSDRLDRFDLFSAAQDDLATAIFGEAVQLSVDGDGRIMVPPALVSFSGLAEQAAFVGMGRKFQIWNPDAFERRRAQAHDNIKTQGLTLPKGGGA